MSATETAHRRTGAYGSIGTRETTDAEHRDHAREKVRLAAQRGEAPADHFPADDLAWAFKGREDELQALEALAAERAKEMAAERERREQGRAIRAETEKVLKEWREAEQAALRKKAEAEAKKRLGIK